MPVSLRVPCDQPDEGGDPAAGRAAVLIRGGGAARPLCRARVAWRACWPGGAPEIGDQAADCRGAAGPARRAPTLLRRIAVPSEKRIRTLISRSTRPASTSHRGLARGLAGAGRMDGLLTAIAIDGKWLRGIGDGQQVKLFAAMLQEEKVIIAQHSIPEETNETTQVRQLLDPVDLKDAVVTGDAAPRIGQPRSTSPRPGRMAGGTARTSCSSRATSRRCSGRSTTPSRPSAAASRTTASWTTATAGSSSAPWGHRRR